MVGQNACVPLIGSIFFLVSFAIATLFSEGGLIGGATGSRGVFFLVIFVVIHCGRASSSAAEFPSQSLLSPFPTLTLSPPPEMMESSADEEVSNPLSRGISVNSLTPLNP